MNLAEKAVKYPLMPILSAGALVGLLTGLSGFLSPWGSILLLLLPGALLVTWLAYVHPQWIIYFLLVFMPFENLVLKFVPGPDQVYVAAGFFGEILIYLTLGFVIARKLMSGRFLRKTPIDSILLVFMIIAFLSIWVNQAPLLGSLANIRVLIRYLFLFYLVSNLDFSPEQVSRMMRLIIVLGVIEIFVGFLQLVGGERLNEILLPRQTEFSIAGMSREFVLVSRGREIGAIFGTLGDTLFFALFMLVVLAAYLSLVERPNPKHLVFFGVIFLAANLAYARAVVFGILLMLLWFYRTRYGFPKLLAWLYPFLIVIPILVLFIANAPLPALRFINPNKEEATIIDNITGIFTKDYILLAQNQRLGALLGIPPTVLANHPILGYGPDQTTTIEKLNKSSPSFLFRPLFERGFEDVYWVAILAYYGVIGLTLWVLIFYMLYHFAQRVYLTSKKKVTRGLAVTIVCLVIVSVALLFFYRILEFRIFGFYFWLFAGLLVSLNSYERRHLGSISQE